MQASSILYILRANGIDEKDIEIFSQKLKDKEFTLDKCDKLLEKMGYDKIFIVDNDDIEDEDNDYYPSFDDDYKDRYKKENDNLFE